MTIVGEDFLFGLHLNLDKKIAPISVEDFFFAGGEPSTEFGWKNR